MNRHNRRLLSGNEAVGLAAFHCGVALGTGYPGTPSTEILESFSAFGGRAEWAPNEKIAAEVALVLSTLILRFDKMDEAIKIFRQSGIEIVDKISMFTR